ncbi:unnamed protein product [Victoria cruziana]
MTFPRLEAAISVERILRTREATIAAAEGSHRLPQQVGGRDGGEGGRRLVGAAILPHLSGGLQRRPPPHINPKATEYSMVLQRDNLTRRSHSLHCMITVNPYPLITEWIIGSAHHGRI